MTRLTGKLAWTGWDGRNVPKITRTSQDYGGMDEILTVEMKELDEWNLESATQRLNPGGSTPIYGLYRYVPRNRVWFLRFSVLK